MIEQPSSKVEVTISTRKVAAALQAGANIAVIGLCLIVGWLVLSRQALPPSPAAPPMYRIGETIDPVPSVDFGVARSTLVMVLRQDCRFCKESLPFYQQLTQAHFAQQGSTVRIVVASTDSQATLSEFLQSSGIRVDQVATIDQGALKVPGTPALLLVDQAGKVLKVWRGKLSEDKQKEVLRSLGLSAAE